MAALRCACSGALLAAIVSAAAPGVLAQLPASNAALEQAAGVHSVKAFGAVGDGKTDDTDAFQRALAAAYEAGGGTAFVPPGAYLIAGRLAIHPNVCLMGSWQAPPASNVAASWRPTATEGVQMLGSTLMAVQGAGSAEGEPFIAMRSNAALKGLVIYYPEQKKTNPPVAYPWTIRGSGGNCSIMDVLLVNPYQGVNFNGAGRHYIRGLYGQPLYRGLYVDTCLDCGRVEDVHFWPFWDKSEAVMQFIRDNAIAFTFGRTDQQMLARCFALKYYIGYQFVPAPPDAAQPGAAGILMDTCNADGCTYGYMVEKVSPLSGLRVMNSHVGKLVVKDSNHGIVQLTNCKLSSASNEAMAVLDGSDQVAFMNCHFFNRAKDEVGGPMIQANRGQLTVMGCHFRRPDKTQIALGPELASAVIVGNTFCGAQRIVNECRGDVQIGLNVVTPAPTQP